MDSYNLKKLALGSFVFIAGLNGIRHLGSTSLLMMPVHISGTIVSIVAGAAFIKESYSELVQQQNVEPAENVQL